MYGGGDVWGEGCMGGGDVWGEGMCGGRGCVGGEGMCGGRVYILPRLPSIGHEDNFCSLLGEKAGVGVGGGRVAQLLRSSSKCCA